MNTAESADRSVSEWARETIERACQELHGRGVLNGRVDVEVSWAIPFSVLIGRVREDRADGEEYWITGGALPVDFIAASAATTPRDAARHFALRWHLEAERLTNLPRSERSGEAAALDPQRLGAGVAKDAEALYAIFEQDRYWPDSGAGAASPKR